MVVRTARNCWKCTVLQPMLYGHGWLLFQQFCWTANITIKRSSWRICLRRYAVSLRDEVHRRLSANNDCGGFRRDSLLINNFRLKILFPEQFIHSTINYRSQSSSEWLCLWYTFLIQLWVRVVFIRVVYVSVQLWWVWFV